jgi:hypothetical protein
MKPMPAIIPAPVTAAQPTGGRIRPRRSRAADGAGRLADDVAEQDPDGDRRGVGAGQEAPADRDSHVRQGEQRHDQVARPRMQQLLEPVIRRDRRPHAFPRVAGQLGGGLLAEQPERCRRLRQVAPRRGVGQREHAHHQAGHHGVNPGLEERDPGRHPEQHVGRAAADTRPARHDHRGEDGHAGTQRGQVDVGAVHQRDDHDPGHVIDDRERQQIGAYPVGHALADQGQQAERERCVRGHGRAPAGR